MLIRPAQLSDLESIMSIEECAHDYPWTREIMQRYLARPDSVWLLEKNGKHLAQAVIRQTADEAELLMISVHPQKQGLGLGKTLLQYLMDKLKTKQVVNLFLEVRESNTPAIRLYETQGMAEVGRRANYYPKGKTREDALIYSIDLSV